MTSLCLLLALAPSASSKATEAAVSLVFESHDEAVATHDLDWLKEQAPVQQVRVFEPYERRAVTFEAVSLPTVLDAAYGKRWRSEEELLFTCSDGYQPSVPVQRVLEHRAWLAFARTGSAHFTVDKIESGEKRVVDVAPFYLVWENLDDELMRQESDYGWPYQLVGIDLIKSAERFPGLAPPAGSSEDVQSGFRAFRVHCSKCHQLNGEGGSMGPELTAVLKPTEGRAPGWLHAWIMEPNRIRPGTRMPALNPALPDRDRVAEDIVTYLRAMEN